MGLVDGLQHAGNFLLYKETNYGIAYYNNGKIRPKVYLL